MTEGKPPGERYRNRELSWLDFNDRVLALAEDERVPLLERAKFLAIFSQNLDEFFQVRVAGLKDQVAAGVATTSPDGRTAGAAAPGHPRPPRQVAATDAGGVPRPGVAGAGRGRHSAVVVGRPRRGGREVPGRDVRGAHLPGPHPAGGRPGPPLPLHLQPVAQPGRDGARPGGAGTPLRPGQGAVAAAPVRGPARRRALRAAGAGHRRPPRPALPGHGDRAAPRLPGHPQRRPDPRGGGGRRPAGRRRDRAATAALRPGRAAGDRRRHVRRGARAAPAGARRWPTTTSTSHVAPLDLGGLWAVHGLDRPDLKDPPYRGSRRHGSRRTRASGSTCSRPCGAATCSSTTHTRASARPSRSSCARRRPIPTCWRSR